MKSPLWRGALVVVIGVGVSTCRIGDLVNSPAQAILEVVPSLPDMIIDSAAVGSTAGRANPLTIKNLGGGELDWTAATKNGSPWISFEPESGKAGDPMQVVFHPDSLSARTYTDTVVITTPSGIAKTPVQFTIYECRPRPINYGDAPSDTLNSADCGSPHRSAGQFAEFFSFNGTAGDSASVIVTPQFNGYVALDTNPLKPSPGPLATTTDCNGDGSMQCFYYFILPRTTIYFVEVTSASRADSGAFKLQLIHVGRQPNLPDSLDQRQPDSTTSIPSGSTTGASLLLRAVVSDSDIVDTLHLEAEVRPVAQAFTNTPTNTGAEVPNGRPAWVSVTGLSDATSYHWQVRTIDQTGRPSAWKPSSSTFTVQTGHDPNPPNTAQYQSDGTTPIPSGGTLNGTTVVWKSTVSDPDGGTVQLRVEAQPLATPFTNNPTASSTFVPSGQVATASQAALTDGATYHWQSQTFDGVRQSAWQPGSTFVVSQAPSKLVFSVQPTQTVAGATITPAIKVTAQDQNNNTITSFTGTVTMAFAAGTAPPGAVLSGTLSQPAVAGVATFPDLSINKSGTTYKLQASAVINSNTISTNSSTFTIVAGPATQLVFSVEPPSNVVATSTVTPTVTVQATDALLNVQPSFTGSVSLGFITNPGGSVLTGSPVNAVAGVAQFTSLNINKTGSGYILQATSGTLKPDTTAAFNVVAGPVTHLAFVVQPGSAQAGQTIAPPVAVAGEDANGNINATFSANVSVAIGTNPPPGTGVLSGTKTQPAISGTATFSDLSINVANTSGGYTLVATTTASGVTGATSNAFNITTSPVSATQSTVQAAPTTITASSGSSTSTITVTAKDGSGNLVQGASAQLQVTGTGNTVLPASATTGANGVATFTLSSTVAEVKTITAFINSTQITSSQPTVTVNPGTITNLFFNVQPSQTTAGLAITPAVQVTARDAFTNTVTSFTGNVTMTVGSGPGGSLTGTTVAAAAGGVATFSNLRIRTPVGSYQLQASIAAPAVSATSSAFSIVAGSATRDTFIVQPSTTAVQARIDSAVGGVVVWITDSIGNLASSSASVTVALFDNPAGATLGGTKTRSAPGNGIVTFNDLTVSKIGTAFTLIANSSGLASDVSAPFNVIPGPAKTLAFKVGPSTVVAGQAITPAVQVVAFDAVGDTATGFTGSVTMALNPSSGTLGGTVTVAAVSGIATFSNLTVAVAGNYTLTASATGVTSVTSGSFTVQPGGVSATNSTITRSPTTITACKTSCSPGTSTASTITVTAKDALGNPIAGQTVVLSSNGTGDAIAQPAAVTDVNGIATGTISDTVAEAVTVSATIATTLITPTALVTVTAGTPAILAFISQPRDTTAGAPLRAPSPGVQVRIQDQFHNNVPGATTSVGISILIPPSPNNGATLSGSPNPKAAVSGVATFTNLSINKVGTGYVLVATGLPTTDTSSAFNITAGTATQLSITTQPSTSAQSGVAFAQQPAVQLLDANNNPVSQSGVVITATINSGPGGGSLTNSTATTNASGLATFSGLAISGTAGSYTLHFASGSLTAVNSSAIALSAGSATQLGITTQPSTSAQSGVAFAQQPAIQLLDASNNPVSQSGIVITATINSGPGGGSLTNPTATTNASGLATFSGLAISGTVGSYTLHFASGSLTAVNSSSIALSAGTANKLSITTQPSSSAQSGVAFLQQPVIQVLDAANNPVSQSGISVTATINTGGGTIGGTTSASTNASGVATFLNLSISGTIGNRTLHFAASVPPLTGVNSATINLTAGPASKLAFTTPPSTTTAGQTIGGGTGVVVTVQDAQGNTATTYNTGVTVAITSGTGTTGANLSGTIPVTPVNGVATFSDLSIDSAGTNYKLDATSGSLTGVTSSQFNINPGALNKLVFTVQPSNAAANTNISPAIVVTAQDAIGNTVTSFTGNVVMTIGVDGALLPPATLGGTTTQAAVAGVATFSDLQIDQPGTGYKLQAAAGAVTVLSGAFNIL